jgi:hypothetical protein
MRPPTQGTLIRGLNSVLDAFRRPGGAEQSDAGERWLMAYRLSSQSAVRAGTISWL